MLPCPRWHVRRPQLDQLSLIHKSSASRATPDTAPPDAVHAPPWDALVGAPQVYRKMEDDSHPPEEVPTVLITWLTVVEAARLALACRKYFKSAVREEWVPRLVALGHLEPSYRGRFWTYALRVRALERHLAFELNLDSDSAKSSVCSLSIDSPCGVHHDTELGSSILEYLDRQEIDSVVLDEIQRDVTRTCPTYHQFASPDAPGIKWLIQVLKAMVVLHADVGYCQGMNFVAAYLLIQTQCPVSTFFLFESIVRNIGVAALYGPRLPTLAVRIHQAIDMLQRRLPTLWTHLEQHGTHAHFFAPHVFLSLFTHWFNPEDILVLWDKFFVHGWSAFFECIISVLHSRTDILMSSNSEQIRRTIQDLRGSAFDVFPDAPTFMRSMTSFHIQHEELILSNATYRQEMLLNVLDDLVGMSGTPSGTWKYVGAWKVMRIYDLLFFDPDIVSPINSPFEGQQADPLSLMATPAPLRDWSVEFFDHPDEDIDGLVSTSTRVGDILEGCDLLYEDGRRYLVLAMQNLDTLASLISEYDQRIQNQSASLMRDINRTEDELHKAMQSLESAEQKTTEAVHKLNDLKKQKEESVVRVHEMITNSGTSMKQITNLRRGVGALEMKVDACRGTVQVRMDDQGVIQNMINQLLKTKEDQTQTLYSLLTGKKGCKAALVSSVLLAGAEVPLSVLDVIRKTLDS